MERSWRESNRRKFVAGRKKPAGERKRGMGRWKRCRDCLSACVVLLLFACSYPLPDYSDWDMTQEMCDSLRFLSEHHYTTNDNFQVIGDSLKLNREVSGKDSLFVYKGDELVVADCRIVPKDTVEQVWIKVARDQETIGWVSEQALLENIVPVDPISKFIHLFSSVHVIVFLVVLGLFMLLFLYRRIKRQHLRIFGYRDIKSIYPVLLCMLVACSATLYASMQLFVPETWQHYYYHPTLNPFELPCILACFIASVWAIVMVALAVLDDLFHQTDFSTAFFYLLGLGTVCLFCYLFFTITTLCYVGYPCLCLFLCCSYRLLRKMSHRYVCGYCGKEIEQKGVCPHCGALNK